VRVRPRGVPVHQALRRMRLMAVAAKACSRSTLPRPDVSGLVDTSGCGGLMDGAFDPGAGAVALVPGVGLLLGAGVAEGFVQVAGA
jgi:hypothetical protein